MSEKIYSETHTQVFEDFIIKLIRKDVIKNYCCGKDELRDFYKNDFRSADNPSFHKFVKGLYRYWYIDRFTRRLVVFRKEWIDYLNRIDKAHHDLRQIIDEKSIINKEKCRICLVKFSDDSQFEVHSESTRHQIRLQYLTDKISFNQSEDLQLNVLELNNVSEPKKSLSMKFEQKTNINATLHLVNKSEIHIDVTEVIQINRLITDISMTVKYVQKSNKLKPGEHVVIVLNGYFENSASFVFPIAAVAKYDKKTEYFLKEIKIEVTSEFSDLKSEMPYSKIKKADVGYTEVNDYIIPGKRPRPYDSFYKETFPLKTFEIPFTMDRELKEIIRKYPSFIERSHFSSINKVLHSTFAERLGIDPAISETNYCDLLLALVHIEENQLKVDIREFDAESKLICRGGNRYELEVPGLAESRPSLMVNDSIYVKESKYDPQKFQGIVHDVLETAVVLGFSRRFANVFITNKKFQIQFGFNRRSLKVEKQAISLTNQHNIVSYFYPNKEPIVISQEDNKQINFFNPILNEEQKRAVVNILDPKPAPYLIFGPPGTGKTVTVVEAILQIWKRQPNSRILVCAPSNAATNEIASRLIDKIPTTDIFRLIGNIYGKDAKLNQLKSIVNINKGGLFYMPSMEDMLKYRVLLTTLVTAARIVNGGVPDGHYSHVFIDESGYATESQSLIPVAGILSNGRNRGKVTGQIVLAGDPRQLGPVVHSKFAEDCGYGTSMLERLINTCRIYARSENAPLPYNEKYVTKLVRNYRSHRAILKTPNELFYHNELIPVGTELSDLFTGWEYLKVPGFPLIFHHVVGEDMREASSPSFFNIQEIEEVVEYISKLEGKRAKGILINQDHIGVISPYRKQVEMLRKAFKRKNWNNILVGSVEQFQGNEKLIIIVSTVRSKHVNKFEEIDKKCQLGFIRNPKRFNVAITRAKALLIVIGNALVLKNDKNWLNLIQYCVENKSVSGKPFDLSNNEYLNEEIPLETEELETAEKNS